MSFGSRATRLEACLSAIPTYAMGLYFHPDGIHKKLDSIRARYYWEGIGDKRKYHMSNWESLALPKDFGGLGFLDTRLRNLALLAKWIFLVENGVPDNLCAELLRKKYLTRGGIFQFNKIEGSQFWKGLLNIRGWVKRGCSWLVGKGSHVFFWEDVWARSCPLKVYFHSLYIICNQQGCVVADAARMGIDGFTFRRNFDQTERVEWEELRDIVENITLTNDNDMLQWDLEHKKTFSSSSMYRFLSFRGIADYKMNIMWKAPIPLKVKHFLWLVSRDRIQAAAVLKSRNWEGSDFCKIYGEVKTTKHVMFDCPMAKFVWCVCRDALDWAIVPGSFEMVLHLGLEGFSDKHCKTVMMIIGA
uniref:Reverse transcriptase zinc-binding domain-containing protein n=1 Tax=Oryza brachyantha TaxID=4533 RepID=J3LHY0_ORYBR